MLSIFVFKDNHVFIEESNSSEKVVIVQEERDGIDLDGIESLEDLPRLVSSMKNVGFLK